MYLRRENVVGVCNYGACLVFLGCLAVVTMAPGVAQADITAAMVDLHEFEARVSGMPDFDQQRAGLNYDGKMHCGPTSVANVLSYFAQNGYPLVRPYNRDYEPALSDRETEREKVVTITRLLQDLAEDMNGYDPDGFDIGDERDDGSYEGIGEEPIASVLEDRLPTGFHVTIEGTKGFAGDGLATHISPLKIFQHFRNGSILIARIDKFKYHGEEEDVDGTAGTYWTREGSHWIVPTGVTSVPTDFALTPSKKYLYWSDPSRTHDVNSDGLYSQDPFAEESSLLRKYKLWDESGTSRTRWQLVDRSESGGKKSFLTQLIVITPDR